MFKFILVSTLLVATSAQYNGYNGDPKTAAILSEQRYLSGNGHFGTAYDQEDGTNFKEETDADGNRHGSYSYIDSTGQRKTVSYVAGKNGFQASGDDVAVVPSAPHRLQYQPNFDSQGRSFDSQGYEDGQYDPRWNDPSFSRQNSRAKSQVSGDHLPVAPVAPQAPAPVHHQPQYQPQGQFQPQPQFQPQAQSQPQYQPKFDNQGRSSDNQGYEDGQYDPRWNDPSFSQQNSRVAPAPVVTPAPAPVQNFHHQPAPVNNYHHQQPAQAPVAHNFNHAGPW